LINQTLQEIEIILVADTSNDNSLEICHSYAERFPEKVKVINPKINKRLGAARNLGIEAAKGEYIGFVDSDDWVETDMFEALYNQASEHNSDLCYASLVTFNDAGNNVRNSHIYNFPTGNISETDIKKIIVEHKTFIQKSIYRKSIFIAQNIRFPENVRSEDIMIDPLFILYTSNISSVNKNFYHYWVRSSSLLNVRDGNKYLERLTVTKCIVEEYKNRRFYEKYKDEINFFYFRKGYIHSAISYLINCKKIDKKILKEIKTYLLKIDSNYRKNPYYKKHKSFMLIDKVLDNILLIKLLKATLKVMKYSI
jgi:glycosyltransferase involved in cell wall biosynthesis